MTTRFVPQGGGKYADCSGGCDGGRITVAFLGAVTGACEVECPVCKGEGFEDDRGPARIARDPAVGAQLGALIGEKPAATN